MQNDEFMEKHGEHVLTAMQQMVSFWVEQFGRTTTPHDRDMAQSALNSWQQIYADAVATVQGEDQAKAQFSDLDLHPWAGGTVVIAFGNPFDGMRLVGPLDSGTAAEYAEQHRLGDDGEFYIVDLAVPESEDERDHRETDKGTRTYPEGTHRDDMLPVDALDECYDLWASGAWPESNAGPNLDEVMDHLARLLGRPSLDEREV